MGTLGYMAPEQIRGDLKEIGPACDIYALGVILYELLTGRLPFSGSGLAVAGQILTQAPLPPSTHRADLDPRLEAICLKAMAKEVGDRYASMAELAAALTGFLQSPSATPTPTAPVGSPASPSPTSGERPRPAGSDSLVAQFLAQLAGNKASPSSDPDSGAGAAHAANAAALRRASGGTAGHAPHRAGVGEPDRARKIPSHWRSLHRRLPVRTALATWSGHRRPSVGCCSGLSWRQPHHQSNVPSSGVIVLENVPENGAVEVDGDKVMVTPGRREPLTIKAQAGEHVVVVKRGDHCSWARA